MAPPRSREGTPADRELGRRGGRYTDGDRGGRYGRDDRDMRGGRNDYRSRRHDGRSRSPVRRDGGARDSPRQRSPPRNPRGSRASPSRDRMDLAKGSTQPSSRAPTGPKSTAKGDLTNGSNHTPDLDDAMDEDETLDPEEREARRQEEIMRRAMGFAKFRTTKNTKVPGNDKNYGVSKKKPTEYRQYMNRVGGFNRPLSPSRE
ncbi:hypothetical protein MBLNU457_7199t1 [Dothideomycetes sp. NU457]